MNTYIAFVTVPPKEADSLAEKILEARLAACVNIMPLVKSKYWWKDNIETDEESLLIIKTAESKSDELIEFVKTHHSYEVPEVIFMPIIKGNDDYLSWLVTETTKK